ncbi:MAG: glycoside hydrolase family 5 protein [Deltaproteobacteria bacterium]|nr:glycoside hydrolase family 5 protein [Deltaproteobacteria bacterium]
MTGSVLRFGSPFFVASFVSTLVACTSVAPRVAAPGVVMSATPPAPKYGRLAVIGTHLCGSDGQPVQLRGMSTMGLQWHGEIVNAKAFAALAKDWKADVVRLALYVGEGGYATHPELKQFVWKGIELAIANGLYVIVDWHVLTPGNPNAPEYAGAPAFFDEVSRKYGKYPNLLYEIMNEPNGALDWAADLKPYAQKMVATIRANDPQGIILIGSGTWSQDVHLAAADPLLGRNLMYTFHFYAGSHGEALRSKVQAAIDRGAAVFCSEWGTSEASGDGGPYLRAALEWLAFLDRHTISWVNWSLCDKSETSAALKSLAVALKEGRTDLLERESLLVPETRGPEGHALWGPDELSSSGAFVRAQMRARAEAAAAAAKK